MHRIKVSTDWGWMTLDRRHLPGVTGRKVGALSWGAFDRSDVFTLTHLPSYWW